MAWKRPNIVEMILQDPMKLSTYLRVPVEDLPYDEGISVWNRRGRIRSMYGVLNKHASLSLGEGAHGSLDLASQLVIGKNVIAGGQIVVR